jgi:hypothetical protein
MPVRLASPEPRLVGGALQFETTVGDEAVLEVAVLVHGGSLSDGLVDGDGVVV